MKLFKKFIGSYVMSFSRPIAIFKKEDIADRSSVRLEELVFDAERIIIRRF